MVAPIGAVVVTIDSADNVVFSEIFSEFVAGFFCPSSGNPLASFALTAESPSIGSNVGAASIHAQILVDALVALGDGFLAFTTIGFWLLL